MVVKHWLLALVDLKNISCHLKRNLQFLRPVLPPVNLLADGTPLVANFVLITHTTQNHFGSVVIDTYN